MSASYKQSAAILAKMEGGYCNGSQCGTAASGETYRGIDRKQAGKTWKGWALIDAWKKKNGTVPYLYFFTINDGPIGPQINALADRFWAAWWNQWGANKLQNQHLAAMWYAWSAQGPSRAIADLNTLAKKYGAKKTSNSTITDDVAKAINNNLAVVYGTLRARIAKFYDDKGLTTIRRNRVDVFPVTISNKKQVARDPLTTLLAFAAPALFS